MKYGKVFELNPSQQEDCLDGDICGDSCYTECVPAGNIQPKVLAACGLQRERKGGGTTKIICKEQLLFSIIASYSGSACTRQKLVSPSSHKTLNNMSGSSSSAFFFQLHQCESK